MDIYTAVTPLNSIMNGLGQQQKVVSVNIANAHTPGYTKKNYQFSDVLGQMANPFENNLSLRMGASLENQFTNDSNRPVNLSEEMMEMQKISLYHSTVGRVITNHFSLLRRAVQIGR